MRSMNTVYFLSYTDLNFNFYIDVYYVDITKLECRLWGWGDLGRKGKRKVIGHVTGKACAIGRR